MERSNMIRKTVQKTIDSANDILNSLKTKTKHKILVVEDNTLNRKMVSDLLSDSYDVIEAENGMVGLQILEKDFRNISVVLLDIQMPIMDGYRFLEELRRNPVLSYTPVIVMTSLTNSDEEEKCLKLGATDFINKPYNPGVLISRVNGIVKLRDTAAALKAVEHDELTGLYTRQAFIYHAENILKKDPDTRYDLIIGDIEDFKLVNEKFGTDVGDILLGYIGERIRRYVGSNVIAGRYGGDQFIALVEYDDSMYAKELLTKLPKFSTQGNLPQIVIKFGLYQNVEHNLSIPTLGDRALLAMNSIKHQYGKNLAIYDEKMREVMERTHQIESGMKTALEQEQFKIFYQPKHDVKTGNLVGAEALIRWEHPEYGFLPPFEFIPLFEKNGFVVEADYFVWNKVCQNLRKWIDAGLPVVPISVNASKLDFLQENYLEAINKPLDEYKLDRQYLHIEVTESLFAENADNLTELLTQARNEGFKVELDDFGTGYSSLNVLGSLPMDVLKLDLSFMRQIHDDRRMKVLAACINLAKTLELKTVAEGVETEEQAALLKKLGADTIQGYYYAKPMPEEEFEQYLLKHVKQ